ncbi:MAG: TIGR03435 family protein [Terracidiphilus sp.]
MFTQLDCGRRSPVVLCFVVLLLSGSIISLRAQAPASASPQVADANSKPLAYEVVSIKPHQPGDLRASIQSPPDGYRSINMPLSDLVWGAYVNEPGTEIKGLPDWANSDPYDVEAKVDAETAEAWSKLPPAEVRKQRMAMMQSLLADRCKLKVHWETREGPVYDLVIARGGLKMKAASPDEVSGLFGDSKSNKQHLTAHAVTVESVIGFAGDAGRKVVDKTGLGGKKFDYEIEWTPDGEATADDPGISIFTALEEQLGLKLVPSKGPVDTLVIDHIEKPTPN